MEFNKATLGVVTAVCIVAGAAGAYLVNRTTPSSDLTPTTATIAPTAPAVEESEAVVGEGATETPAAAQTSGEARRARVATPSRQTRSARTAPSPAAPPASTHSPEATRDAGASSPPPVEQVTPTYPEPTPAASLAPAFEELVVPTDSVIGLEMETSVSSERARIEDQVVAQVTRDVKVGDRVAIPSGAKAYGEVTLVERGGRMRDRARLGIRFTSIVLGDGTRVPIDTDAIIREGSSPTGESAAKIGGGALGGAIIGGILGGAKGAIIGSSTGAGAGTAAVLAGGRNPATLPSGAPVTVRLLKPATVTVER